MEKEGDADTQTLNETGRYSFTGCLPDKQMLRNPQPPPSQDEVNHALERLQKLQQENVTDEDKIKEVASVMCWLAWTAVSDNKLLKQLVKGLSGANTVRPA